MRALFFVTAVVAVSLAAAGRKTNCPDYCFCTDDSVMCTNNELTAIPHELPPDTMHLDLSHNLISEIKSDQFAQLRKLRTIRISNNKLFHVRPHAFRGLPDLREIELRDNPLKALPAMSFSDLADVRVIDLSSNKIDVIARDTFAGSSDVGQLNLNFNPLTGIESFAFANLTGVGKLSIATANEVALRPDTFNGLRDVHSLIFVSNMTDVPAYALRGLRDVRVLQMACASNASISSLAFSGAENIKNIQLKGVAYIERFAFYGVVNVGKLYLDDVATLDFASLVGLAGELDRLDMGQSRFNCNCYWQWINKYDSTQLSREHLQKIVCNAPPKYDGLSVTDVKFEEMDCPPAATPSLPDSDDSELHMHTPTSDGVDAAKAEPESGTSMLGACAVVTALSALLGLLI